jgi:uncharacterized protein YqgQ
MVFVASIDTFTCLAYENNFSYLVTEYHIPESYINQWKHKDNEGSVYQCPVCGEYEYLTDSEYDIMMSAEEMQNSRLPEIKDILKKHNIEIINYFKDRTADIIKQIEGYKLIQHIDIDDKEDWYKNGNDYYCIKQDYWENDIEVLRVQC